MHSRDSLELDGCVDERLAQKHMSCVDQVESRGVCFRMKEKAFDLRRLQYIRTAGRAVALIMNMESLTPGSCLNFSMPPFRSIPVNPIPN